MTTGPTSDFPGERSWPCTSNNDANIPYRQGILWAVKLVNVTVDDLTIYNYVDFSSAVSANVLHADSVAIVGSSGEVVVTIDSAQIDVHY